MELLISLFWLAVVAALITRAAIQGRSFRTLPPGPPPPDAPSVAIIVPARDEAGNIGQCATALAAQTYPSDRVAITVVDDHSRDGTRAIVGKLSALEPRVRLIQAGPLPPGWFGKQNACQTGAYATGAATWLCFVDADVLVGPEALASAVAEAEARGLDLLSLTPRQRLVSISERLVIPCGLYLLSFVQELKDVAEPESEGVSVTGQFMLIRRSAYEAVGGHAAVRDTVVEDLALGRLFKRAGYRVSLRGGDKLMTARMYSGLSTLWPGFAKNLVDMLGGPLRTTILGVLTLLVVWAAILIPAFGVASLAAEPTPMRLVAVVVSALATMAAFAFHIAGAIFLRIPSLYGLLFPLGYTLGAAIAFDSVRRRLTGRTAWKGRTYT